MVSLTIYDRSPMKVTLFKIHIKSTLCLKYLVEIFMIVHNWQNISIVYFSFQSRDCAWKDSEEEDLEVRAYSRHIEVVGGYRTSFV